MSTSSIPAESPYELLYNALSLIPTSHYLLGFLVLYFLFLYNLLDIHFLEDLFNGLRGDSVSLTCNSTSQLYKLVASKCQLLHGRYLPTPWLFSPHIQTSYLSLFAGSPSFTYSRRLFHAQDGGTIALDWLLYSDVCKGDSNVNNITPSEKVPIVIIIPGLTSDSADAYVKHITFKMAGCGCNVVVVNHRGLGGISITSDCFYNAGWTEDIRAVIDHVHKEFVEAPLFAVGTSIGANILVKYLGEDGVNTPLFGAAAVCSPWDLLICDRFINRRLVQKLYNKVLAFGLQGYAQRHQSVLSRIADWEGIKKSRTVRDYDNYATRLLAKCETVDTYYRNASSVSLVGKVSVPLLCISALDDPVCTREAIPWDECRTNENIILATTKHGGHLAFFEGVAARSLWWVRAVDEFFRVLHSSPLRSIKKTQTLSLSSPLETSVGEGPYVNVMEDGIVAVMTEKVTENTSQDQETSNEHMVIEGNLVEGINIEHIVDDASDEQGRDINENRSLKSTPENNQLEQNVKKLLSPVRKCLAQLLQKSKVSTWLLLWIAIATTWPLGGPAILMFLKKKLKRIVPTPLLKR